MKPLAVGVWNFAGTFEERLAKCARAGFRHLELRDEPACRALTREQLARLGLEVVLFEEHPARPFDPQALACAAALGARFFLHAPREVETSSPRLDLAASLGLRSLVRASDPAAAQRRDLAVLWDSLERPHGALELDALLPRIAYVRFRDGDAGAVTALGAGAVDFPAQMRSLREVLRALPCWGIDFAGCPHAEREARKATGFLRELARALQLSTPAP
jgi:sugar phosphate isomerase/epimerase